MSFFRKPTPLPVTQGGTGNVYNTYGYAIIGNGYSAYLELTPSTSGNVMTSNGTTWTSAPPSGGGSGTVNSGTQYQLGYYATTGTAISGNANIKTDANSNLNLAATSATLNSANTFGFKNRVINGLMVIDQRDNGLALTVSASNSASFGIDRYQVWNYPSSATGLYTWQQLSATPPTGFTYYGRATVTTAISSLTANNFYTIQQAIEGYNLADLDFGTANAKPFTVSFWVRSSLTGTFSCAINFGVSGYGYALTYTINSANTWEFKTLNFPAFTSSNAITNKTTSTSLYLIFQLGLGSNYTGSTGVFNSAIYGVTGSTNLISTNGATLDITGIQFEIGTQATSFDFRDYGSELILCYRYYEKMYEPCGMGRCNNTPSARFFARFTVLKRTTPTITGTGSFAVSDLYTTDATQTANQGINGSTAITTSGFSFSILCSTLDNPTPFVTGTLAANLTNTGVLTGSAEL